MKKLSVILVLAMGLVLAASAAFAAATEGAAAAPDAVKIGFFGTVAFASAVGIAVAAFGGSIGMGLSISKAMEGIARNPEASGKIMTTMIVGLALIESLAIYTLVVVLILLYAKPFGI